MKEILLNFLKSNRFKAFAWHTFNWSMTLIATYIFDLDLALSPLLFALLNLITKEANKYFNPNIK